MVGPRSQALFEEAKARIPGGVNSPVRAFRAVGGTPFFVERAEGPYLYDVDGRRYVDLVCSWGPIVLGHADPRVVEAVCAAARRGTSYGTPNPLEVELARRVIDAFPGVEMVRFVNSGTEATMSALRLARGATGRDRVIKFAGGYHGHADLLLAQAGSGVETLSIPGTPGVPEGAVRDTLVAPYNDLEAVEALFRRFPDEIAAVIVEPVAGNMGLILPEPGFLEGLRELTRRHGALLIFDEVITGFRLGPGGAQERFGVVPDLTCLGKVIGGGLPVGAYGGRRELMEQMAPTGPIYQAGTLSGNPLAMAAGIATLDALAAEDGYRRLEERARTLAQILREEAAAAGVTVTVHQIGGIVGLFFSPGPVRNLEEVRRSDVEAYRRFFWGMLEAGVFLAPSAFECLFVSLAHTDPVLEEVRQAARQAFAAVAAG